MNPSTVHTIMHIMHLSLQLLILGLVITYTRIIRKHNNRRP